MNKEVQAVILAGGRGGRMGTLTSDQQKCLLSFHEKPVLSYVFDNVIEAFGSAELTLCLGYQGINVKEFYREQYRSLKLNYVYDQRSLETRRRLLLARNYLPGPFLVLPGDVICHPDQLVKVVESYERDKKLALGSISGAVDHYPALTHALIQISEGKVIEMIYPALQSWAGEYYREMGVAFYDHRFLHVLTNAPDNYLYISDVISNALVNKETFLANIYSNKWYHFSSPSDFSQPFDSTFCYEY